MADEVKKETSGTGLEKNLAGFLAYVLGWITGLIFWITEKDKFVRFHAMQSILFSGVLTVLAFLSPILYFIPGLIFIIWLIEIGAFVLWIMLMIKAYNKEEWELPVLGKIARQIVNKN